MRSGLIVAGLPVCYAAVVNEGEQTSAVDAPAILPGQSGRIFRSMLSDRAIRRQLPVVATCVPATRRSILFDFASRRSPAGHFFRRPAPGHYRRCRAALRRQHDFDALFVVL